MNEKRSDDATNRQADDSSGTELNAIVECWSNEADFLLCLDTEDWGDIEIPLTNEGVIELITELVSVVDQDPLLNDEAVFDCELDAGSDRGDADGS